MGCVWEVFPEKIIFELRYNFTIQKKKCFFIILSVNIFLNSFFPFIKNADCTYTLSQYYSYLLFVCRLLIQGFRVGYTEKYSPDIPRRIIADLITLFICRHHLFVSTISLFGDALYCLQSTFTYNAQ